MWGKIWGGGLAPQAPGERRLMIIYLIKRYVYAVTDGVYWPSLSSDDDDDDDPSALDKYTLIS